jgi:predicted Zn-dependent protease
MLVPFFHSAAIMSKTHKRFSFPLMFLILSGLQAFCPGCASRGATPSAVTVSSKTSPPQAVRIIFFTPSDLAMPAGARERLTKIADATEKFFFKGMNQWGYPPAVKSLFRRESDGLVEVLTVKGDMPVSSGKYARPNYAQDVIDLATRQYHLAEEGQIWWIFIYLGDRPARFQDFVGTGNPRDGGHAMVNYDSVSGEIRPDLGLAEGFNGEYFLKGTIHELGHAFGLHHVGPNLALGLGNSLMGPTTAAYVKRNYPKPEQNYLTEADAAILWKHPFFTGIPMDHDIRLPSVKLADYKPVFNPADDSVTISGKLIADQPAHSVILIDDLGRPRDQYWVQSHAARLGPGGVFQIKINKPAKTDGHYGILFCFNNGLVTGDGVNIVFNNRGDVRKSYSFNNGDYQFGE